MSNPDTPHGFRFAYTLHGGPPSLKKYPCGTANGVYAGDIVLWSTSGVIPKSTGTDVDPNAAGNSFAIGVAASYSASGSSDSVWVYDDLFNTVFMAQVDSSGITFSTSYHAQRYASTWVAGSTVTGLSAQEIDLGSTGQCIRVLDLVDMPNNTTADAHQEVYCSILPAVGSLYGGATTA